MRTAEISRARLLVAFGVMAAGSVAAIVPGGVIRAGTGTTTLQDTGTITTFLDHAGGGELDAFDPTLGTLTGVELSIETTVLTQNCIENLSSESGSNVGGPVSANLTVEFPGGQNATTSAIGTTIPSTALPASNGSDDCSPGPDPGTGHYNSPVSSSDVLFDEATDADSTTLTLTAADDLSAFVGPGTVPYSFTSSSNADITQPSEWDIVFVAQGTYRVTVRYSYTGGSTGSSVPCVPPTTTVPGQAPPTTTPGAVPCAPPPCVPPTTTVAGQTPPTTATGAVPCRPPCVEPTTTQPGDPAGPPQSVAPGSSLCVLPATGGSVDGTVTIAVLLTTLGLGAIALGTRRRRRVT